MSFVLKISGVEVKKISGRVLKEERSDGTHDAEISLTSQH